MTNASGRTALKKSRPTPGGKRAPVKRSRSAARPIQSAGPSSPAAHSQLENVATVDITFAVVSSLLTHNRPKLPSLTDGQMVAWYEDLQKRDGVIVNRYNRRHGRLLEINEHGIARVLQHRGWPPHPHYEFVRIDELEEA